MASARILVVEDDALDAQQFELSLQREGPGFAVERVATLAQAVARVTECQPDLIALDLSLPDAFGEETFDRMHAAAPHVAIVVLTGREDETLARRLLQKGAQDYLTKSGLSAREIVRCLNYAIDRGAIEREIERARNAAEGLAQAKSTFLASMSHEIRTPLSAILGMADLLLRTPLASDQRTYVEVFRRAGHGLRDLLDNVLELSRLESGRFQMREESFDPAELIADCVEIFAFEAHRRGLTLIGDLDPALSGAWQGDRARLRQILVNLIGNAVKFTEQGTITVRAGCVGDRVGIDVEDTGPGVPADQTDRIFERFVQVEVAGRSNPGGSGLGLPLSRELIGRMGGTLQYLAAPAGGALFRVELPLHRVPGQTVACDRLAGMRVLVADDHPEERAVVRRQLEALGAKVSDCASAAAARELMARTSYDAAVLDSRMPGGGGIALLEELNGSAIRPPRVVIMLMMAHRPDDHAQCRALEASVIYKPARSTALVAALRGEGPDVLHAVADAPETPLSAHVLVAEDSIDNRLLIESFLAGTGVEWDCVEDGLAAVTAFERNDFDLVLMDVSMPKLDGHEATRRIREIERRAGRVRTPVVALSAHAFPEDIAASERSGCDAHVTKPFDRRQLLDTIARWASRPTGALEAQDVVSDLVPAYLARRREDVETLRAALAEPDLAVVRTLGHRMKGTGSGYGLPLITEIGAALELAARAGDAEAALRATERLQAFVESPARASRPAAEGRRSAPLD